jgi:hypothetical protein
MSHLFAGIPVPYLTGLLARPYQIWQLGRKGAGMDFELSEDQAAFRDVASAFAAEHMAPFAAQWDEKTRSFRATC